MKRSEASRYYISRKRKLLRNDEKWLLRIRVSLIRRYGEAFADEILPNVRKELGKTLAEAPYIGGGRNVWTPVIISAVKLIAFHRVMRTRGKTVEETADVVCEATENFYSSYSSFRLWGLRKLLFSAPARWYFKTQARRSRKREYEDDWVWDFESGKGEDFVARFEMHECGECKFYKAQGVEELSRYCNFFDVLTSQHLGLGLVMDSHLGSGDKSCVYRFKQGRQTEVPPNLKPFIAAR